MPKRKPTTKPDLSRVELLLVRLCLFAALGISVYLAWSSLQGGGIPGCGPDSGCDKVLSSRWAYLFGLPVSIFAAPVYAGMLALLWQRQFKWPALVLGAAVILIAALWFVSLQFFILGEFCKFCMTAHAAGVIAAIVLLRRNPIAARKSFGWAAAGAGAVALLVAGQYAVEPRSGAQRVDYASAPPRTNETGVDAKPAATYTILQGQKTLDLMSVPVHGRLDAPKKVVKLFDYTCRHCRAMHHHFQPLLHTYSNELAVISLVMPIDRDCNPLIRQTPSAHTNACEFARLGLAVFYADREKSDEFDDWVFAPLRPPPLAEAHRFAASLVGSNALAKSLLDPRIEQQIQENIGIYATNSRLGGSAKMPQLLFPEGTTVGASLSVADLRMMLAQAIGLETNRTILQP